MDIKFNKDGPVTFGALGGTYPQMNARAGEFAVVSGIVRNGVLSSAVGDIVRPDNAASVTITLNGTKYTADSGVLGEPFHLAGPVVNEYHKAVPLTNHLTARWVIRKYVGFDTPRVDLTIENDWAYEPSPQNFTYDVEVSIGGKVVYSQAKLTHFHHARWRMVFGDFGVVAEYPWQDTKAIPHYGPEVPAESVLQDCAAKLANTGPMKIGAATDYMPQTGAHADIGVMPQWQWAHVMSHDPRARAATLATADGSGGFSMHYRDKATDRVVSLKDHPRMTLVGHSTDAGADAFPGQGGDFNSPYTADIAHHPSLAYYPYLLTGDYYYLEELQFWAMYCAFNSNPGYRGAEKGLLVPEQLRGQAWALRTIGQAAFITPDTHRAKQELVGIVNNNLDWYNATYTNNPGANKIGVITNGYAIAYDNETATATWMHDFLVSTVGELVKLGFDKARPFLGWLSKFTLGRMLEVSWTIGAPYGLRVRDTSSSPIYDSIKQCYTAVLGEVFMALPPASPVMAQAWNKTGYPMNMYPSDGVYAGDMGNIAFGYEGYPSNMQPALATLVDNDVPGAKQAWDNFMSRSVKCDYTLGGQFNVTPKNYTAQPVAPYVDTDTRKWDQIGKEGDTVTVPADTTVRYGANGLFIERVCSGAVIVSNKTFGMDPAPNVPKILQQLIPQPPEGNTVTYTVLLVPITGPVELPAGSESTPTSTIAEILTADKSTVLATSGVAPYSFPGITAGDRTWRLTDYDSKGAIMGKAVSGAFTLPDDTVVTPPVDTTPVTATLTTGATVSWTKD